VRAFGIMRFRTRERAEQFKMPRVHREYIREFATRELHGQRDGSHAAARVIDRNCLRAAKYSFLIRTS